MSDQKDFHKVLEAARAKIWPNTCYKGQNVTRRKLLSNGALSMVSFAALPSLISMLYNQRAYGLECKVAGANEDAAIAPFLQIELSGGWAPAGAFMFGKQNGGQDFQSLAAGSYAKLGLTPDAEPGANGNNMDTSFGGSPLVANGGFLMGLNSIITDQLVKDRIKIIGIAGSSNDDSRGNPLNVARLALQVSGGKADIAQLIGTNDNNALTRGRTADVGVENGSAVGTGVVTTPQDAVSLVDPGAIGRSLSPAAATKILEAAERMSQAQLAKFQAKSLPQQIKDLVSCGYVGSRELSQVSAANLDPATELAGITGVNAANADDQQVGTISKMLLDGNSAAATIEMGNYDYHGRGLANQRQMDANAGRTVGIALQMAANRNQPLAIFISTDGSVSCNNNTDANVPGRFAPSNDLGANSAGLFIMLGATAAPDMNHFQVGKFSDAGAVDTSYLATSNNAQLQALCAVANYAAAIGKMSVFEAIMAQSGVANPFKDNKIAYLAFKDMA